MKYHCRCRICGARQTRSRHPDDFKPRCSQCGRVSTLRVDKWANRRPWRKNLCVCAAYSFVHRKGSGKCLHKIYDKELYEERAAIAEFCGEQPRDVAEGIAALEQQGK